jgi:hypothetical protein
MRGDHRKPKGKTREEGGWQRETVLLFLCSLHSFPFFPLHFSFFFPRGRRRQRGHTVYISTTSNDCKDENVTRNKK